MARSRRRFTRRSTSRPKADWVYRGNIHDESGALLDEQGTYVASTRTLAAGGPNAFAGILYDSHNYVKVGSAVSGPGSMIPFPSSGRAEGGTALIRRVQGVIMVRPSTWALGSSYRLGLRFGAFEQDPAVGLLLIDPLYNMWTAVANTDIAPSTWANDRMWTREWRVAQEFSDNSALFTYRFNFPCRRKLNPNQCFAVYCETFAGSASINMQFWLRTLVSDEG